MTLSLFGNFFLRITIRKLQIEINFKEIKNN